MVGETESEMTSHFYFILFGPHKDGGVIDKVKK